MGQQCPLSRLINLWLKFFDLASDSFFAAKLSGLTPLTYWFKIKKAVWVSLLSDQKSQQPSKWSQKAKTCFFYLVNKNVLKHDTQLSLHPCHIKVRCLYALCQEMSVCKQSVACLNIYISAASLKETSLVMYKSPSQTQKENTFKVILYNILYIGAYYQIVWR